MAAPGTSGQPLAECIAQNKLSHIKVGITDIDGVMRGKYLASADLLAGLGSGLTFCDCIVGWDCDDTLYTNNPVGITGWHTGYPDMPVAVVEATARSLPTEFGGRGLLVLAEMAGEAAAICPRTTLRRVIDKAASMGFEPVVGFEYEFALFNESRESARAKGFRDLTPVTPGNFGYSVLRTSSLSDFCEDTLETFTAMDVPIGAFHTENGPGIWEAAIQASDALSAADRAAVFKTFMKSLAQRRGLLATFMAKWSVEHQGQGGHIHISLRDARTKEPVFLDENDPNGMSDTMRHFVAGQLRLLPELAAFVAPTVNSYTRLTPGAWAPTAATWGHDNRTCALRVVGRSSSSRRVEYRVAAADANPYLALAAALASGLHGIEARLEIPAPIKGNSYEQRLPDTARLPASLGEAASRLRQSATARSLLGDMLVDHFAASREWEEARFRAAVTDWELKRYFEII